MKQKFHRLVEKLNQEGEAAFSGGFAMIRGGMRANNTGNCNNSGTSCSGTNTGTCNNAHDCSQATNGSNCTTNAC